MGPKTEKVKEYKQEKFVVHRESNRFYGNDHRQKYAVVMKTVKEALPKLRLSLNTDRKYFAKDSDDKDQKKSADTLLLEQSIAMAKQSLAVTLGNRVFKLRLNDAFLLTATVTSGIVNTIANVECSNSPEFNSCVALFEEYRIISGDVEFQWLGRGKYAPGSVSASPNDALVLCYDIDATALTSVQNGCEFAQHRLYCSPPGGTNSTGTTVNTDGAKMLHFPYVVPDGVLNQPGSTVNTASQWCPTANPASFGRIKSYQVGSEIVAKNVGAGIIFFNCEFRMRGS